mgnify:CR=1 FL=1|tara:strand:- start:1166 stop:1672 length:507 start_codon:yes stop_codon:yes gene_type:complete
MSFTRFHDDPCRIKKNLQESVDQGLYYLNTPGNGTNLPFIEDPHIRLTKWGANLRSNTTNLESDLKGLTRKLAPNDSKTKNDYKANSVASSPMLFSQYNRPITLQPRTTNPAWTARDLEQVNWYILPLDPQENTCMNFQNNLNTNLLEKDNHKPKIPCLEQNLGLWAK